MQITFIGHASILIETRGLRIISDPWWLGPCFGAQWWIYPPPYLDPVQTKLDYIYISHGHNDHLRIFGAIALNYLVVCVQSLVHHVHRCHETLSKESVGEVLCHLPFHGEIGVSESAGEVPFLEVRLI